MYEMERRLAALELLVTERLALESTAKLTDLADQLQYGPGAVSRDPEIRDAALGVMRNVFRRHKEYSLGVAFGAP